MAKTPLHRWGVFVSKMMYNIYGVRLDTPIFRPGLPAYTRKNALSYVGHFCYPHTLNMVKLRQEVQMISIVCTLKDCKELEVFQQAVIKDRETYHKRPDQEAKRLYGNYLRTGTIPIVVVRYCEHVINYYANMEVNR